MFSINWAMFCSFGCVSVCNFSTKWWVVSWYVDFEIGYIWVCTMANTTSYAIISRMQLLMPIQIANACTCLAAYVTYTMAWWFSRSFDVFAVAGVFVFFFSSARLTSTMLHQHPIQPVVIRKSTNACMNGWIFLLHFNFAHRRKVSHLIEKYWRKQ